MTDVVPAAVAVLAVAAIVIAAIGGWRRGGVRIVFGVLGLVAGLVAGCALARVLPLENVGPVLRLTLIAGVVVGTALLGSGLARRAGSGPAVSPPGTIGRITGALVRGGLVAVVIAVVLPVGIGRAVAARVRSAIDDVAPEQLAALVPAQSIALPTSTEVASVRDAVAPSVVSISASGCPGRTVQGTGFAVTGSLVVTNAHVLRGQSSFTVSAPGGSLVAVPVAYDAPDDLAVLSVDGLDAHPLPLAGADAPTGTRAVVVGYPRGNFGAVGAVVAQRFPIFDPGLTSGLRLHEAYRLRTHVEHGNSGSPVLDLRGRVIGVVNALETNGSAGGYAITLDELRPVLADAAAGRQTGVGSCTS